MPNLNRAAVVLACLAVAATAVLAPAPPAQAASAYDDMVDITFPTDPRVRYTDSYFAARSGGRVHRATDLLGEKMWPLYAAVDGEVCSVTIPEPRWGYALTLCGDDGREYRYLHINNDTPGTDDGRGGPEHAYAPGIAEGVRVQRGQLVAYMGDSGNAEWVTAHLHFEIEDASIRDPYGSSRMNPYASLEAARAREDFGGAVAPIGAEEAEAVVERRGGLNRYRTTAIANAGVEEADEVVIANGGRYQPSLVAGPLAAALDAPLLTLPADHLEAGTNRRLRQWGTKRVVLVGSFSEEVRDGLRELGVDEIRSLSGPDPYTLASAVADEVWRATGTAAQQRRAVVVLGGHPEKGRAWPDAVTASTMGSAITTPVLLVEPDVVPGPTAAAAEGLERAWIIGGSAAISDGVRAELRRLAGPDAPVRRLAGRTRTRTALAVADWLLAGPWKGEEPERVWAANAFGWADGIAAGPVVARDRSVLVLVDGKGHRDGPTGEWLAVQEQISRAVVLGSSAAVSDQTLQRLERWVDAD